MDIYCQNCYATLRTDDKICEECLTKVKRKRQLKPFFKFSPKSEPMKAQKAKKTGIRPAQLIFLTWIIVEIIAIYVFHTYIEAGLSGSDLENSIFSISVVVTMVFILYMLPSILGRNRSDGWLIFFANLFLGWTVVGWGWAFLASIVTDRKANQRA